MKTKQTFIGKAEEEARAIAEEAPAALFRWTWDAFVQLMTDDQQFTSQVWRAVSDAMLARDTQHCMTLAKGLSMRARSKQSLTLDFMYGEGGSEEKIFS